MQEFLFSQILKKARNAHPPDGFCFIKRSIRSFCIGKKNWQIIDSKQRAEASTMYYSIAETIKANGLKPREYFQYVLEQMLLHLDDKPEEYIHDLVPWSGKLPESCKRQIK